MAVSPSEETLVVVTDSSQLYQITLSSAELGKVDTMWSYENLVITRYTKQELLEHICYIAFQMFPEINAVITGLHVFNRIHMTYPLPWTVMSPVTV